MKERSTKTAYAVTILILLGVAMRIMGAWCFAQAHTADHGIICLMVKHIIEGKELPVFFYGLPYMGAIEPYTSVLFCKLFGLTGFMINMGTAVMGILLLPIVYLWGRDAGGRAAGVAALAFCVVGPEFYFQFQSWADGGYAAIVLIDALLLWVGMRVLNRARVHGGIPLWGYLLMGFLGGIAWFQSPLTISAMLTLALIYLAVLRLKIFSWGLIWAAVAFVLGSLPLWIWNLKNNWQTFDMLETHGRPEFLHGLKLYYVDRLFTLLDLDLGYPVMNYIMLGIYLVAAIICVGYLLERMLKRDICDHHYHLLAALLFIVVSSILFTRSHLALAPAVRYLVPIVPPIAVILATASALCARRTPWGLAWVPLILLVAYQSALLPKRNRERQDFESFAERAEEFADFLEEKGVTHIYTRYQVPWANHGLNFLLDERFVFSEFSRERYQPYARSMEEADSVAVLNNLGNIDAFLHASGGSALQGGVEGLNLHYNLSPPPDGNLIEIDPDRWAALELDDGRDARRELGDDDMDTALNLCQGGRTSERIELTLAAPAEISMLRLTLPCEERPSAINIKLAAGGEWKTVLDLATVTGYYWSGPRVYWGGDSYRIDLRFAPLETDRVRIELDFMQGLHESNLAELQVFESERRSARQANDAGLDELRSLLKTRDIEAVYADRYLSSKLGDDFRVVRDFAFYSDPLPRRIELTPATVFVVDRRESSLIQRVLAKAGVGMKRTELGNWAIYRFDDDGWREHYADYPGLYWRGYAPLLQSDKLLASYYVDRARDSSEERALKLLEKAIGMYPNHQEAMRIMADKLDALGRAQEADEWRARLRQLRKPDIPAEVDFANGLRLLGIGAVPDLIAPGGSFIMKYHWQVPEDLDPNLLAVFVHFKLGSEIVFQDDHVLLVGADTKEQPFDEVFVEERRVAVPSGIESGDIDLIMGVYERTGRGNRIKFKSELDAGGYRSFRMPLEIRIGKGN